MMRLAPADAASGAEDGTPDDGEDAKKYTIVFPRTSRPHPRPCFPWKDMHL